MTTRRCGASGLANGAGARHGLASSPTLCRSNSGWTGKAAVAFHQVLIEKFIASFAEAPPSLILDFDATDDACMARRKAASIMATTATGASSALCVLRRAAVGLLSRRQPRRCPACLGDPEVTHAAPARGVAGKCA